ncbi:MAG: uroporphyrinogen decarboxylase family protein, partial [Actinomycetota bacterium]
MNYKGRIMAALNREQPDRVPVFELLIDEISVVNLAKLLFPDTKAQAKKTRFGEESSKILDLYCSIIGELHIDSTTTNFSVGLKEIDESRGRDKFGTLYYLSTHGEPIPLEGPVNCPEDVKKIDMVSKLEDRDFDGVRYVTGKVGKEKAHFLNVMDPFKLSWRLTGGMQNLLEDYVLYPEMVHNLARIATDFDMAVIDMASKIGIDVIAMPGDLATEENTIMSPEHYRKFIKPYHVELANHAHKKGLKIIKHTDGNFWPILDDFIEAGFDGLHPIQPQCMNIGEVKKYTEGKVCIIGNIDCRNLLPFGTQEEVEKVVKKTIEIAGKGGGYIISSS